MPEPVRVAVVDDYEVVVRGVAALLEHDPRVEVVELAVNEPVREPIDVALFDTFGSAHLTGDLLKMVVANEHVDAVAAYTTRFDERLRDWVLEQGARGYLPKSLSGTELADAVVRIAAGETVVVEPPAVNGGAVQGSWPGKDVGLTEREADTLALLVKGLENEAIAEELYVSPNTVKARLKSIYRKIDAGNRVQAALWAVSHGFEPDRHIIWGGRRD